MSQQPQPIVSADGRWWWDGRFWRPMFVASPPGPPPVPQPQPTKPRSRKTRYVVLASVAAFALLVGAALGTGVWFLTRGNPSHLASFRIGFHSTFDWPFARSYDLKQVDGQPTMVFDVHAGKSLGTDAQTLLPEAEALQAIINRYAPDYDGQVQVSFWQHRRVVASVTFHAHDTLTADMFETPGTPS